MNEEGTVMTPAVNFAKKAKIKFNLHRYNHDESAASFGEEAATKLNVNKERVFKTLVVSLDDKELAVAIAPVSKQLDLKACAAQFDAKKCRMADQKDVERSTGYVVGGVSPLGQKKMLRTVIDKSALALETIYVSAGKRGLQIELSPKDLCEAVNGAFASISAS
jgi:Cys-tRNA(Pro)/Cys-tRNA(Cys) deacylase